MTDTSPEWNNWHWQYQNRICDAEALSRVLDLNEVEKEHVTRCLTRFRMAITPYYASLIDPFDSGDPIRLQAVPSIEEMDVSPWEMSDPLNEEGASPLENVVHRYPDRVLFLVTDCCAMYCRHCTRRRLVGENDGAMSEKLIEAALEYIRQTPGIHDVLVSGGDSLTLPDRQLESILSRLRAIEHVEVIRLGTRIPVTMPMRITPELLRMLKKYQPIWINTHFNHPKELTEAAVLACTQIVDAGFPLGNQSVLLKGINDNDGVMRKLVRRLIQARIRPYYLYQCDLSEGLEHFRTDVRVGINIIKELHGSIAGFAVPSFVIDAPGGGGKIPLSPDYIVSVDDEKIVMRNYYGDNYEYPQPSGKGPTYITG